MQIPVLIEKVESNGFRASGSAPFNFSVEAASRDAALEQFRQRVRNQLASGAEIVQVDVGETDRPWMKFCGSWAADDPVIDEWIKCVEEYRRQVDADPNIP